MAPQPGDMRPARPAVLAAEEAGGLDAGVERAVRARQAPGGLHRVLALRVAKPLARMRPARAAVGGGPDRRAEPLVAAGGVDGTGGRVGDGMVDRPGLAEGAAGRPLAPVRALEQEKTFTGTHQHAQLAAHTGSPCMRGEYCAPACDGHASAIPALTSPSRRCSRSASSA